MGMFKINLLEAGLLALYAVCIFEIMNWANVCKNYPPNILLLLTYELRKLEWV